MFGASLRASFGVLASRPTPGGDPGALLHVRDQKSDQTVGGTASVGNNVRVLNTIMTNEVLGSSLGSNRITLPAGTYWVEASAPAYRANRHKATFYNVTDAVTALVGESAYAPNASLISSKSVIAGRLTITSTKVFELRHYIQTSGGGTSGLGLFAGDPATLVEVYGEVLIMKISN